MKKTKHKIIIIILLALYVIYFIALLKITILRYPNPEIRSINLIPFATIAEYFEFMLDGRITTGIFNVLGNFVLFFPLGYITALLFLKMRSTSKILILAFVFSSIIEITQYVFECGSTDIDDLILNTLGAAAGYWIYILVSKLFNYQNYLIKKCSVSIILFVVVLSCVGLYICSNYGLSVNSITGYEMPSTTPYEILEKNAGILSSIDINSTHAFLIQIDKDEDKILFDKGGNERIYPASMTKIMTAVIVLENINDIDVKITLQNETFAAIYGSNSSVAGFLPGETVRAIDLLYGLMLPSGGECAIGLANYVSESESAFVDLMNNKAHQLGMNDTHFMNATGLHNKKHYSSAKDIALLVKYALKNDTFYKTFTTERYSTIPTNLHTGGITFYSTLFSKIDSAKLKDCAILGGKTGYTDEAGQCLASLAENDGKQFILVTCGAPGNNKTQELHIDDAFAIYAAISKQGEYLQLIQQ